MTIPFVKIFSLFLRLFTRPIVNFVKNTFKKKTEHPVGMERTLVSLGNFQNRLNVMIQRKYLGVEHTDSKINPVAKDKAFDMGAELLSDVLVYGTLFSWGIYELVKAANSARTKEEQYKHALIDVKDRLEVAQIRNKLLQENLSVLISDMQTRKQSDEQPADSPSS